MSTDRTDQYPEVSTEDTALVPPQGAPKSEWPKKIRTLTAAELDRLTIDAFGRFHWDGKLVNYDSHPSRLEKPVDLDQHAMELLDRTARELSDPNHAQPVPELQPVPEMQPEPVALAAPALAATPNDAIVPVAPTAAPAPVVEPPRQEITVAAPAPAQPETKRVKFTLLQSIGIFFGVIGLLAAATGIAVSSLVAANEWGCKVGWVKNYCPAPPEAPKPPPRPDIPA